MAKRSISKLSSFFNAETYLEPLTSVEDILNQNITIAGVDWRKGPNGEYAVFDVTVTETGMEVKVSSGAMAICQMLRTAETQRIFPFACKITKSNRMYIPVDPD